MDKFTQEDIDRLADLKNPAHAPLTDEEKVEVKELEAAKVEAAKEPRV